MTPHHPLFVTLSFIILLVYPFLNLNILGYLNSVGIAWLPTMSRLSKQLIGVLFHYCFCQGIHIVFFLFASLWCEMEGYVM